MKLILKKSSSIINAFSEGAIPCFFLFQPPKYYPNAMKSPYNYMYFLALLFTSVWVQAQPIELYTQFNGQYDFTAIGNTLLPVDNTDNEESSNCDIFTESSAELNLASGQDVVAAYLYWAGVGEGDFEVQLNGLDITPDRTFSETYGDQPYFGACSDITDVVQASGYGTYT